MFSLQVKQISGETLKVELENGVDSLVSEVKFKLVELTGVESARQRLIFLGRVLQDTEPLRQYGITDESIVQFVSRPQDIPPPASADPPPPPSITSSSIPQLRNLGNGVLMGSITIDSSNISRETPQLQNIIGQMVSMAQNFVTGSEPLSSQTAQPSPVPPPTRSSSQSMHLNLISAHLNSILQTISSNSQQSSLPLQDTLHSNLHEMHRVLHGLQMPILDLAQSLPANFDEQQPVHLPRETLIEIINIAHMLRSLSSAASLLANTLEQVTNGPTPANIPTVPPLPHHVGASSANVEISITPQPVQSGSRLDQGSHRDRADGEPFDLILDDISIEDGDAEVE